MPDHVPECFCKGFNECDWTVKITGEMYQEGSNDTVKPKTLFEIENLPQPAAQLLFQAAVAGVNENGLKVYGEWLQEVCGSASAEPVMKVAKDAGLIK